MKTDELGRRALHMTGGFPMALYLLDIMGWSQLKLVYLAGLALAVALEGTRLVVGIDWWVFDEFTRDYERRNPAGYALYVLGSAVVVFGFRPAIAVPAVLTLAVVDPVSGLLSEAERRPVKRPLALGVTFGLSGVIAAGFVPLVAAGAGAAVATVADGATPTVRGYVIDDNIGIPVGMAVSMWAVLVLP